MANPFKKKEQTPPPPPLEEKKVETPIVEPTQDQTQQQGPEQVILEVVTAQNIEAILENIQRQNMILTSMLEEIRKP